MKPFEELIIVGLDIETTGLDVTKGHRTIELCMNVYRGDKELKSITRRFDPQRNIDKKAFEVHGIALEDLKGKPTLKSFAPTLVKILEKCDVLVAHNGMSFDFPFLCTELCEHVKIPDRYVVDNHPDEPILFDTMNEGRWATHNGKWPTLGELCYATDVDYDPAKAHAAKYDVDCMMAAFFMGIRLGAFRVMA